MDEVITRFAPSPTGYLHIGGARTALFSWLYARKNKGRFILRIEDTDQQRSKKEYEEEILLSMKWLGLDYDELVYQSQRFDIYRQYADKLIEQGKACKKEGAVFFKYEFDKIVVDDLIRGKVKWTELPKTEEVIIKSDKTPAYNFACVIDDALLGVSCVIRGEDHLSNTPKQVLMSKALGFDVPKFAHIPLIMSEGGGRMSKRFGATAVSEYRKMGYLPEALVNYLLLLGWSPGNNREIISLDEAKDIFDLKNVNKTAAAFSLDKLNWVNSYYIKQKTAEDLLPLVEGILKGEKAGDFSFSRDYLLQVIRLFKERVSCLREIVEWGDFCFSEEIVYSGDTEKILSKNLAKEIEVLKNNLQPLENFDKTIIEQTLRQTAQDLGLKARDLVHPVRVAVTGKRVGPGLFETMEVLGKNRIINRLSALIDYWKKGG